MSVWEEQEPSIAEEHARFKVTDLASVDWVVRKIARARARFDEQKRLHDAERARLDAWLAECRQTLDDTEAFFVPQLAEWHRLRLEEDPKGAKTIKVPSGRLQARQQPTRVEVTDFDAMVCHVGTDSPLVRTKLEPDKQAIRAAVLDDGESLPGVEVVPGDLKFSVSTEAPVIAPATSDEPW